MEYSLLRSMWNQEFGIPEPELTETNLADQKGKVSLVTGCAGCGFELAKILYQRNGTVFLAGRSPDRGLNAVKAIREQFPDSDGHIEFLKIDLADLSSIKPAVESFLSRSNTLHCLTNNAGVMMTPDGSKSAQGYELQMGTNCLGPYLLTKLLLPVLQRTAASSPAGTVRVTWASSLATEVSSPTGGITFDAQGAPSILGKGANYAQTKVGNVFLSHELAKRYGKDGIISVSWNPGQLGTELGRHLYRLQEFIIRKLFLYPPKLGAYTELYAGYSPAITAEQNGAYIIPWGRIGILRPDVQEEMMVEGGGSVRFWDWCDNETSKWT